MSEPLKKILRYYETVRYLRPQQLFFFAVKPLRKKIALHYFSEKNISIPKPAKLTLVAFLDSENSIWGNTFTFLNRKKNFEKENMDWNFSEYGLLWNYNLNYFDFLLQKDVSAASGLKLIYHFIDNADVRYASFDPYPVSLRGINWIKFFVKNNINDPKINESLFRQYIKLGHETERHLGANHLLENGFSLLFGAYYFNHETFFKCAQRILLRELKEQILNDGAHFELSPMYHRIILHRILDCINLVQNNSEIKNEKLQKLLTEKASLMLSWLNNMTFRNEQSPDFNDSTQNGAPTTNQLIGYARQLDIYPGNVPLSESGYRKFSFPKYELILDAGNIMPSYNPGHSHADMLSFCLNIIDKPVITDCGISTYENNSRRRYERSTAAHNTVSVNGLEQSDVWASFRVGRRARVMGTSREINSFSAAIKGFTSAGISHKREWKFIENKILITDTVSSRHRCKAFLHFHPLIALTHTEDSVSGDNFSVSFSGHEKFSLEDYDFAEGFNTLVKAKVAVILFSGRLVTTIAL